MANNIGAPFEMFTDTSGVPLEDGYIYIGTAGLNPETNPIAVFWDDALTLAAAQPVRTLNGFPSRGGTASRLYTAADYSLTVKDKNSVVVFSTLTNPVSSPAALNGTPIGNVTPSTGAFTTLTFSTSLTSANGASLGWVTLTGGSAAQAINGLYRSAANTVAFASNSTLRGTIGPTGTWALAATSGGATLEVTAFAANYAAQFFGASGQRARVTIVDGQAGNRRYELVSGVDAVGSFGIYDDAGGAYRLKIATTGSSQFLGGVATPEVAVTFSATAMTINCALSNVFRTTFTANVTTAPTLSNLQDGQTINWFITQDATGSRTMTWPTSFKWPSGVAGVLSTAANAVDLVVATYRSATGFWYASLIKDIR